MIKLINYLVIGLELVATGHQSENPWHNTNSQRAGPPREPALVYIVKGYIFLSPF